MTANEVVARYMEPKPATSKIGTLDDTVISVGGWWEFDFNAVCFFPRRLDLDMLHRVEQRMIGEGLGGKIQAAYHEVVHGRLMSVVGYIWHATVQQRTLALALVLSQQAVGNSNTTIGVPAATT